MTDKEDYQVRERLAQLEVEVRHLREDFKDVKKSLNELTDVFQQAKGARYILVVIAALSGFLASWLPTLLKYISILPR